LAVTVPPFTVTGQGPEHAGTAVPSAQMGLLVPPQLFEYVTPPHSTENNESELVWFVLVHVVAPWMTLTAQMVAPHCTTRVM
jgi:hypothetical protein